ncbi:uncharacterized protein SOCG_04956 [Schizosaccharomyces octosporus yFS286]|uniref:Uncharacterized protein n=1 Tax=Schizosaccharomyces octosporus (strain yFS286) TaxID=483514 RepID=S9Q1D2_SCHOY|nr:uncharacterized protein SOCG_04956 [Schizosaccharomyces octosporus yFS286]EPX73523.1 hypothetical protein SOCG_04956 [Schizosaccharomyces octosporus yFS286]
MKTKDEKETRNFFFFFFFYIKGKKKRIGFFILKFKNIYYYLLKKIDFLYFVLCLISSGFFSFLFLFCFVLAFVDKRRDATRFCRSCVSLACAAPTPARPRVGTTTITIFSSIWCKITINKQSAKMLKLERITKQGKSKGKNRNVK